MDKDEPTLGTKPEKKKNIQKEKIFISIYKNRLVVISSDDGVKTLTAKGEKTSAATHQAPAAFPHPPVQSFYSKLQTHLFNMLIS